MMFLGLLMIVILSSPLIILKRIKVEFVPKYSLIIIIAIQILMNIVDTIWNSGKILYPSFFISSLYYYIASNSIKPESKYALDLFDKEVKETHFKAFFYSVFGGALVFLRNYEMINIMKYFYEIIILIVDGKKNYELINNVFSIQITIILFILIIEWITLILQIEARVFLLLSIALFCIGIFNLKWWVGISILTSMVIFGISKEFTDVFFKKKIGERSRIFIKFIIPCISLILYVTLVFVKDVLPDDRAYITFKFMNTITLNEAKTPTPIPSLFIKAIFDSVIEIPVFLVMWIFLIFILKKADTFNVLFFHKVSELNIDVRSFFKDLFLQRKK